jgi:hypothetical protein
MSDASSYEPKMGVGTPCNTHAIFFKQDKLAGKMKIAFQDT